jgi:hypothetical protein
MIWEREIGNFLHHRKNWWDMTDRELVEFINRRKWDSFEEIISILFENQSFSNKKLLRHIMDALKEGEKNTLKTYRKIIKKGDSL